MAQSLPATKTWHDVTEKMFQESIVPLYQPAILKNIVSDWEVIKLVQQSPTALGNYRHQATYQYPPVELFVGDPEIAGRYSYGTSVDEYNFKRVKTDFQNVVNHLSAGLNQPLPVSAYAGAIDIETQMPLFCERNPAPTFLAGKSASARAWIGNAANISTHFDVQDNIACLVSGKREFMLFPPEQVANLYVGPIDKTIAGPPTSLVDMNAPDFKQHPLYAKALEAAQVAVLEPGDALYIPSLWWHNVKSQGQFCMLVNYWWDNPEFGRNKTMLALINGLYSISHLPQAEREAWRALFDHFVFQSNGSPLDYLPDEQRGVLGKMTPQRYSKIENFLLSGLKAS